MKRPPPPAPVEPVATWVRVGGIVVGCAGAALLAIVGAFLTPFRIGGVLVPISLPLVVFGIAGLLQFTRITAGPGLLAVLPGVVWLLLTLVLSSATTEGDIVLSQANWVAIVYLLLGTVTTGVVAYRMILPPQR
jgi:hypothetical protein